MNDVLSEANGSQVHSTFKPRITDTPHPPKVTHTHNTNTHKQTKIQTHTPNITHTLSHRQTDTKTQSKRLTDTGKNTVISKAAGTSERYTNHYVRASTITTLHRGGVTPSRICGVSDMAEHTDGRSLAHYLSDPSAAEKRNHSALFLSRLLQGE